MRSKLSSQNWLVAASILLWISLQPGIAISPLVENTASEWVEEVAVAVADTRVQERKSARPVIAFWNTNPRFHHDTNNTPQHALFAPKVPWHRLHEKWLI